MMLSKKILIFTSNYGEGHKQAADALSKESQFNSSYPINIKVIDFMELIHPVMNSLFRAIYLKSISKFPSLYGLIYSKTSDINFSNDTSKLYMIYARKVSACVKEFKPDVIVSTFPISSACLSVLKAKGIIHVPLVTVITDYGTHRLWIHSNTDIYLVGSSNVRDYLLHCGVDESKIAITGIPIRTESISPDSKSFLKRKYGLNAHRPIILIMGGAYGMFGANMCTMLEKLAQIPVQFVVVCGHNKKLYKTLSNTNTATNIHILGYTNQILELMSISELLISKPGGLTISEAAAKELPMLLFQSIQGQEEENARFLIRNGAAIIAETTEEVIANVKDLLANKTKRLQMKKNMKNIQNKYSALNGMKIILQFATYEEGFVIPDQTKQMT